ncbi:MAG TPA: DUF4838 domain-containing protein [Thermoguttaceae bacterium]|nr:DUF4838 domain-containing protein [Thermoguttaceae bacterium]
MSAGKHTKQMYCVSVVLWVAAQIAVAQEGTDVTLVREGKPTSTILIGSNASSAERYASEELQRYIRKISGALIPIESIGESKTRGTTIVIGTPQTNQAIASSGLIGQSPLGRDGFIIKTSKDRIILAGETSPGALYATYALLEESLGVRWYFPGKDGEYVPATKTVTVKKLDVKQKPAIPLRGLHPVAANTKDPEVANWMARNRMNFLNPIVHAPYHARDVQENVKRGLIFSTATHFGHWLHHGELFDVHPEYFPLLNGTRSKGFPSGYAEGMLQQHNYCLSNMNVVKETAKSIREFVKLYPDVEMIGINQHDSQSWCECEACKALGTPTDILHTFINRLAEELGPVLDDRLLATQAYQMTQRQPTKVKPNEKVVIFYTLITHCARHGWDEYCPSQEEQKANLAAWQKHGNKVIVYTYHADLFPGFPMPMAYHALAGIRYYSKTGIAGWYPEIVPDDPGQHPLQRDPELIWGDEWYSKKLTYYTAAKALWNPSITAEAIKDDYFPKFYGKAGPAMRKYYDTLEDAWHNPGDVRYPHKRILGYNPSTAIDFLKPTLIAKVNGYLAEAQELAAKESDVVKGRIERDALLFAKWDKRYSDTGGEATRR